LLDGVCVNESVADYVACVRAQGAQLGASKSQEISATAGTLGIKAGGAAEVKESLERKYTASDAATLEIVRACGSSAAMSVGAALRPSTFQHSCSNIHFDPGSSSQGPSLQATCKRDDGVAVPSMLVLEGISNQNGVLTRGTGASSFQRSCAKIDIMVSRDQVTLDASCRTMAGHSVPASLSLTGIDSNNGVLTP
jgi:hypothetical protein